MTSLTLARKRELENTMGLCYPETDWKKILKSYEDKTICVPLCVDVLKPNSCRGLLEVAKQGERQNITGTQAEAAFLNRFTELKLGGILIVGLRTTDLERTGKNQNGENVLKDGDWDAIFIHRRRGIFVIEIKAAASVKLANQQMSKAKEQLDNQIENIRQLFGKFFNEPSPPITGIICFPFCPSIFSDASDDSYQHNGYDVIDSTVVCSPEKFKRLFKAKKELSIIHDTLIKIFAAELICCRSEALFHSQAYNSMQIAQWIKTQDYLSKNQKKQESAEGKTQPFTFIERDFGRIILTAQQLEIVSCPDHCITIRGAPGSGKTLIVMLRALTAAKQHRPGRVLVFVNEALMAKYQQYFHEANDHEYIARDPIVLPTDHMTEALSEDEVFFDEMPLQLSDIKEIRKRATAVGKTTVVFTGFDKPGEADSQFRLHEHELSGCDRHFKLNVVLRGTKEIFEEWQTYFHRGTKIGHSITGVAVERPVLNCLESVQQELLGKVRALLSDSENIKNGAVKFARLTLAHLSVITSHAEDADKLRRFFKTNNVANGTVKAQVLYSKPIMAVDTYDRTPSYEWPIVFIVFRSGDLNVTPESVFSIAASRCIASLTIIEYESNSAQLAADYSDLAISEPKDCAVIESLSVINKKEHPTKAQLADSGMHDSNDLRTSLQFFEVLNSQKLKITASNPKSKPAVDIFQKNQQPIQAKTWIALQIGVTANATNQFERFVYAANFFANFVSTANAAGHKLRLKHSHFLNFHSVNAAVEHIRNIDDISSIDYIFALDYSEVAEQARACRYILKKAFPQKPQPFTVLKMKAIKCQPGQKDCDLYMRLLVDTVFRYFEESH